MLLIDTFPGANMYTVQIYSTLPAGGILIVLVFKWWNVKKEVLKYGVEVILMMRRCHDFLSEAHGDS